MPLIREPRTAEARGHRARVAAVMQSVAEKYGGKHAEVFSPDFISVHKPGDRWFCTICFSPLACMADGQPVASNNGVERDGETQRLTVHCSDKDCKKRQCKAIKSTFKDPASMSDALLNRIIALMRETNARMERSLGDVLISSRCKSGKGDKGGKGKCKGRFKGYKGSQRIKNSQGEKCDRVGKGITDTAVVQRAVGIAIPSKPAAEFFFIGSENKKGRGQPHVEVSHEHVGQSFKSQSPALAEAAEMLLNISDRIPFSGVECSSIKMWSTFDCKTRMCRTSKELIEQSTWLVRQFNPKIYNTKWLASWQAEWFEECCRVEDDKHCKLLIQRLQTHAVNWETVKKMWQIDFSKLPPGDVDENKFRRSGGPPVNRQHIQERWRSEFEVHLSGWHRPKRITFLLAKQSGFLLNSSNLHVYNGHPKAVVCGVEMGSVGRMNCVALPYNGLQKAEPKLGNAGPEAGMGGLKMEEEEDWDESEDVDEGDSSLTSSHIDEPPSWTGFDDGDSSVGVKHDRMLPWQHGMHPENRLTDQDFSSPTVSKSPLIRPLSSPALSKRASPPVSPFVQPRELDKIITDMGPSVVCVDHLSDNSEFEVKDEFDGNEVSSMSTEQDYGEANSWHGADFQVDLGLGATVLSLLPPLPSGLVLR